MVNFEKVSIGTSKTISEEVLEDLRDETVYKLPGKHARKKC